MTFIDDAGAGELDDAFDPEPDPTEQLADAGMYDPDECVPGPENEHVVAPYLAVQAAYDVHMNNRARDVHDREAQEWCYLNLK